MVQKGLPPPLDLIVGGRQTCKKMQFSNSLALPPPLDLIVGGREKCKKMHFFNSLLIETGVSISSTGVPKRLQNRSYPDPILDPSLDPSLDPFPTHFGPHARGIECQFGALFGLRPVRKAVRSVPNFGRLRTYFWSTFWTKPARLRGPFFKKLAPILGVFGCSTSPKFDGILMAFWGFRDSG